MVIQSKYFINLGVGRLTSLQPSGNNLVIFKLTDYFAEETQGILLDVQKNSEVILGLVLKLFLVSASYVGYRSKIKMIEEAKRTETKLYKLWQRLNTSSIKKRLERSKIFGIFFRPKKK
ncbi:hypothetical protein KCTC52924_02674 [Arenibacter antarcticus]|nr:hypothetical protein [Arenibacter sp. H213]